MKTSFSFEKIVPEESQFSDAKFVYHILYNEKVIGAVTISDFGSDYGTVKKIHGWKINKTKGFDLLSEGDSIKDITRYVVNNFYSRN